MNRVHYLISMVTTDQNINRNMQGQIFQCPAAARAAQAESWFSNDHKGSGRVSFPSLGLDKERHHRYTCVRMNTDTEFKDALHRR